MKDMGLEKLNSSLKMWIQSNMNGMGLEKNKQ